ncbi:uncharacterized protein [Cherax quadricarinatus]|uniref:uncharacterized protein isoform X1 n=2 Tax=Cherax quadricarinatus TaxID=27406 RepID=UPI00387E609B
MSSSSNDRWIRAAMPLEEWFEMGHKHGTFLACYVLTLGSPQPLDHNHVKQALLHLYRKVPSLRLSMDTRDGVLWFKECTRETIDFEVVTDCDLDNVVSHLRTYRYNCKLGPMWCARFLPAASATVAGESEAAVATTDSISGVPPDGSTSHSDTLPDTSKREDKMLDTAAEAKASAAKREATGAIPRAAPCSGLSSPPSMALLSSALSRSDFSFARCTATPSTESPPLGVAPPPSPDFPNGLASSQPPSSEGSLKSSSKSSESISLPSFPSSAASSVSLPSVSSASTPPSSLSALSSAFSSETDFNLPKTDTTGTSCRSLLPGYSSRSLPEGNLHQSSQTGARCARSEFTSVSDKRPKSAPVCLLPDAQSKRSPRCPLCIGSTQHDCNLQTSTQDPSTLPLAEELWTLWPSKSHLVLGIHHGTADGFTALKICGFFLQLLNDIIAGTPINDDQLAEFVAGETFKLISAKKVATQSNPSPKPPLERKKSELEVFFKGSDDQSLYLTRVLDQSTTKLLKEKCCMEGVSLYSAFCALATVTFVDFLVAKNVIREKYCVSSKHSINMRRYWSGDSSLAFGCHIESINLHTMIQREALADFWSFARSLHEELQEEMDSKSIFGKAVQKELYRPTVHDNEKFMTRQPLSTDYHISDMGDVTAFIHGGPHVRSELVWSTVSIHKFNIPCAHLFHTYRGRFIHTLDYATKYMTTEAATMYCNKIFDRLRKVIL